MAACVVEVKFHFINCVRTPFGLKLNPKINCHNLTSLVVIPSVTRGKAKMQRTVTPSLTQSADSETDGHAMVITVAWCCGESVVSWSFAVTVTPSLITQCECLITHVSINRAPCLPCHVDLIDNYHVQTAVCWRYTVLSVIRLSLADGRPWDT